jgi:hypothetical protein
MHNEKSEQTQQRTQCNKREREIEKKSQWKDKQREIEEIIAANSYKPQKFVDRYDEQGGPKRHDAEHMRLNACVRT